MSAVNYQYYKGYGTTMTKEYEGTMKAIFWMAEKGFAEGIGVSLWLCA